MAVIDVERLSRRIVNQGIGFDFRVDTSDMDNVSLLVWASDSEPTDLEWLGEAEETIQGVLAAEGVRLDPTECELVGEAVIDLLMIEDETTTQYGFEPPL